MTHVTQKGTHMELSQQESSELMLQIGALKQAIDSGAKADISTQLIRIHKDLYNKPETFGLLSDTEIAVLTKGLEMHSSYEILVGKEKPRAKKSFSADDLDL